MSLIFKCSSQAVNAIKNQPVSCRSIFTTSSALLDRKWREDRGLPVNPNRFGPLTNYPDYSFLDGRPTPLGSRQMKRLRRQREIATKVVTLCKEIAFAKDRYTTMQKEKEMERQKILQNQLKPKGHLLLKEK